MNENDALIQVDCGQWMGEIKRIWRSFGYDEINLTYTPRGKDIFQVLKQVEEVPYYIRNHNAFTSGNGAFAPAWGSTNVFNQRMDGSIYYDWTILDKVYDTYVDAGFRPLIELGFMPRDLTSGTFDALNWISDLGKEVYESAGLWKYPPKDYIKWADLVYHFISHLVGRYGRQEVEKWRFELWNEPDIPHYWKGTLEEYCKLYDYSVDAATRALPGVQIGGPGTTCPFQDKPRAYLEGFLKHCVSGINAVTGNTGTRLDFISFHTKGAFYNPRRIYNFQLPVKNESPSSWRMMKDIQAGMEVIKTFPALGSLPVYVDECDPAVGTPYGVYDNPNFIVTNTEHYPNFVCALVKRILDLNEQYDRQIDMITAWAFYYEGKRYFEGNRTLFDNENIEKSILNAFRMLSRLGDMRVAARSNRSRDVLSPEAPSTEVDTLAAISGTKLTVLAWHQTDEWWIEKAAVDLTLKISNLPFSGPAKVTHYRIDRNHSNAYNEWLLQGSPQNPSQAQIQQIKSHMGLEQLEPEKKFVVDTANLELSFSLPLFGTSLIEIKPA